MHMLPRRLDEAREKVYWDQKRKARPSIECRASTASVYIDKIAEYRLKL